MSVKRKALERHLRAHGALFNRNGAKHDVWRAADGRQATVPRHKEIADGTARSICDQLGVPRI